MPTPRISFRPAAATLLALLAAPGRAPAEPPPDPALVEAVRTLAGQHLLTTHYNMDFLGEVRFFGTYEAGQLAQLLAAATDSVGEVDKTLEKLAGLKGLPKDAAAAVARLRKIAKHLTERGDALQKYWDTGVAENWKAADAAREAAWKELDDLLQLNPKKGVAPPPREPGKKKP